MSEPIYITYQVRMTEAWYQLSEKAQKNILDKLDKIDKQLKVEKIILCESGWSNDEWQFWGVDKHMSLEAVQEHYKLLDDIQWSRYVVSKTLLGTPWSRA